MVTVCYDYRYVICGSEKGMRGQGNTPTIIAATKTKAAQNTKALIERVKPIWMPPEQVVSSVLYAACATHKVRKHVFEKQISKTFVLPQTGNSQQPIVSNCCAISAMQG